MNWLNVQTVPPDIFYNPSRIMYVAIDVAEGVWTYVDEGWNEDGQSPQAFFDRRTLVCPSSTKWGKCNPVKVQGGNEGEAGSCQTTAGMVTGEGR